MIRKLEMGCWGPNLGHVARNTILGGDFARRSQTLGCRLSFDLGRVLTSRMARKTLLIVRSYVLAQWLVRIVARRAGYATIIRVTLAVKDAVRLKADIVNLHAAQQTELLTASVA